MGRILKDPAPAPPKKFDDFCGYLGPRNYVSMRKLQNSAGHTLRGPKLRAAQLEGSKTPRGKFAFNLCPAEFWTPQSVPRRVLEQCNVCPAFSWRHSYGGQETHKNHLKLRLSLFLKGFFIFIVNQCHFRDLYNHCDHFLRKKYFAGRYL